MSDDEALIQRWADAVNARDLDTLLELAHPDIELHTLQLGVRGHYTGPAGVAEWMGELREWDPGHRVDVDRIRPLSGDRFAAFGTIMIEGQPSSPYSAINRIADGKVREMRSYPQDEDTLEKMGELD